MFDSQMFPLQEEIINLLQIILKVNETYGNAILQLDETLIESSCNSNSTNCNTIFRFQLDITKGFLI